jgi:hypothetical protein
MSDYKDTSTMTVPVETGTQNGDLREKVSKLKREDSEIIQISNYVIRNGIEQLDKEGSFSYFKSALPSIIVLLISFVIDVSYVPIFGHVANSFSQWLFPGAPPLNTAIEPIQLWWMPIVVYLLFVFFAYRANTTLRYEIQNKGASEGIINKVIDKYSEMIDSIGTALPLLGAGILLVSIKIGPQLFLGFSVPFEIKSIIVLAMAKLFDAVFEAQSLRYQKIVEEVKNVETEYYYQSRNDMQDDLIRKLSEENRKVITEVVMASGTGMEKFNREEVEYIYKLIKLSNDISKEFAVNMESFKNSIQDLSKVKLFDQTLVDQFNAIYSTINNVAGIVQKSSEYSLTLRQQLEAISQLGKEINNLTIKMPDEKALKELQMTAHFLSETVNNLKDPAAEKSIGNLAYIAGKR